MILLLPGWAPPSSEIATKGIPLVRDGKKNYRKGIENEVAGRPDSAFLYFSNALVAFEKESEWDLYSKTCFKLASIKKNARDLRNARAFLRKSDSIRQKFNIRNDSLEAEVYHLKGLLKLMDGQPGIALEDFEQSIRLKKILFGENDTLLAPTYNNMGIIFFNKPDYEEALRYYQLAMNSARGKKANPNPLIPRFTENIGLIYARKGDYNQAMEYFSDALNQKIRISGQNSPDVAISFLNIANLEIDLSNYNIALDYLIKAEKIYIANFGNDYPDLDVVYQNMGKVYNSRSDYEKALNYYNKAIQLLKKKNPNHPRIPELNMNIGYILFVREEYDKALGYYHRSISPDRLSQLNIKVYRNLARCHQRLNHADSALFYYRQSIQISDAMAPGGYEKASGLLYFGEFLQSVGRTNEAEKNIREATRMMETLLGRKNRDLADCYLKLGDLYINTNRPSDALSYFHRAVVALTPGYDEKDIHSIPEALPQNPDYYLLSAFERKAQAYQQVWHDTKNLHFLKLSGQNYVVAGNVLDRIRSTYSSEESNIQFSGNVRQTLQKAMKTHIDLFRGTGDSIYLAEAFRFSEKSKSALLMQAFHDQEELAYGTIPGEFPAKEKILKNKIAGYKKLIHDEMLSPSSNALKIDIWNEEIFNLEREFETLTQHIKKEYPDYYARKYEGKGTTIPALRERLNNEVILEYAFCDSLLYCFVITDRQFNVLESQPGQDFYKSVPALLDVLQQGPTVEPEEQFKAFVNASLLFYNLLIKPASSHIQGKKLIIVPDGVISHIPFETFLTEPPTTMVPNYKDLKFLMTTNCIRYSYLASTLLMPQKKARGMKAMGAFAPVEYHVEVSGQSVFKTDYPQGLASLPASLEEAEKARDIIGGDLFAKDNAGEGAFKSSCTDYQILHLSTHTLIDPLNPAFSRFVMYNTPDSLEDNMLNAFEISSLPLNASLVVLSSCNTGTGRLYSGEGVFNLARGFLYAGVPSVVMTLWEIDDNVGSEIILKFYNNLRKEMPADEALWHAKLSYIKESDRMRSHPYFWSAFVNIGNSNPVSVKNPAWWNYGIVLTICLAGLAAGFAALKNRKKKQAT